MKNTTPNNKTLDASKLEWKAILLTVWANLGFGLLGIGFSLLTDSEAILLDGIFSFVNFLVGLITLRVSKLVMEPGDQHYPFGYAIFEPMLNLAKGLIIITVCVLAFTSSVESILSGGREIQLGSALIYASIASFGCLLLAFILPRLAKKSASPIVAVDAKNWIVDGVMSVAVLLGFFAVNLLQEPPYQQWIPYVDPALVIVLIILSISIPIKIVKENWGQIVGKAPPESEIQHAETIIQKHVSALKHVTHHVRSGRFGRLFYIQVYLIAEQNHDFSLQQQDQIRGKLYQNLQKTFPNLALDVIFTSQSIWVQRAISVA